MRYVKLFESWVLNEATDPLNNAGIQSKIQKIADIAKKIGEDEGKKAAAAIESTGKQAKPDAAWTASLPSFNVYDKAKEIVVNNIKDLYPSNIADVASETARLKSNMVVMVKKILNAYYEQGKSQGWAKKTGGEIVPMETVDAEKVAIVDGYKKMYSSPEKFYADAYTSVAKDSIPKNIVDLISPGEKPSTAPEQKPR